MSLADDAAVLVLAEQIARGKTVNVDEAVTVTIPFQKEPFIMPLKLVEKAAQVAEERRAYGYFGGAEDHAKNKAAAERFAAEKNAREAAKKDEKPEKKGKKAKT